MLSRMDMAVVVVMRSVRMDMCMSVFVTGFIHVSMLVKMLVCMSVTVFVIA